MGARGRAAWIGKASSRAQGSEVAVTRADEYTRTNENENLNLMRSLSGRASDVRPIPTAGSWKPAMPMRRRADVRELPNHDSDKKKSRVWNTLSQCAGPAGRVRIRVRQTNRQSSELARSRPTPSEGSMVTCQPRDQPSRAMMAKEEGSRWQTSVNSSRDEDERRETVEQRDPGTLIRPELTRPHARTLVQTSGISRLPRPSPSTKR